MHTAGGATTVGSRTQAHAFARVAKAFTRHAATRASACSPRPVPPSLASCLLLHGAEEAQVSCQFLPQLLCGDWCLLLFLCVTEHPCGSAQEF